MAGDRKLVWCPVMLRRLIERLEEDETLLVQSGKPLGVFRTHANAPRVLIANSNLVPKWATWEKFNELDRKGLSGVRPDDGRKLDLHRQPGDHPRHVRNLPESAAACSVSGAGSAGSAVKRARRGGGACSR